MRFAILMVATGLIACSNGNAKDAEQKDTGKETLVAAKSPSPKGGANPQIVFETSMGQIEIELFQDKAPITTQNILNYVDEGFYNGTIFHRIIPGFVVQGGGFTAAMEQKETKAPIKNEATNGLKNLRGTLSMARTNVVDSGTSQFFINLVDNGRLDQTSPTPRGFGYAVFGKVTKGMEVVDEMAKKPTCPKAGPDVCTARLPMGMQDVPAAPITITKAYRK